MSELSYKELQEKGVFDVPYRAFEFMQQQQTNYDELEKLYIQQGLNMHKLQQKIDAAKVSLKEEFWDMDLESFGIVGIFIEVNKIEEILG